MPPLRSHQLTRILSTFKIGRDPRTIDSRRRWKNGGNSPEDTSKISLEDFAGTREYILNGLNGYPRRQSYQGVIIGLILSGDLIASCPVTPVKWPPRHSDIDAIQHTQQFWAKRGIDYNSDECHEVVSRMTQLITLLDKWDRNLKS